MEAGTKSKINYGLKKCVFAITQSTKLYALIETFIFSPAEADSFGPMVGIYDMGYNSAIKF